MSLGRWTDSGSCSAPTLVINFFPPVVPCTNTSLPAPNDSGLIKYSQLCPLVSCYLVSYKNKKKKKLVCECRVWLNGTRNIRQQSLSLVCHSTANIGKLKWSIPVPYKELLQTAKTNLSLFVLRRQMGYWMSLRPSAWNDSALTGPIFTKFDNLVFFRNSVEKKIQVPLKS